MAEYCVQLPDDKRFPTVEDMHGWQKAYDELIPSDRKNELIGFKIVETGQLMGVCRGKTKGLS